MGNVCVYMGMCHLDHRANFPVGKIVKGVNSLFLLTGCIKGLVFFLFCPFTTCKRIDFIHLLFYTVFCLMNIFILPLSTLSTTGIVIKILLEPCFQNFNFSLIFTNIFDGNIFDLITGHITYWNLSNSLSILFHLNLILFHSYVFLIFYFQFNF